MALGRRRWLVLLVSICWAGLGLAMQDGGTRLEGRVVKEGRGVVGVVVLVGGINLIETTDAEGRFAFDGIAPGAYTLILTLGTNSLTRENVGVLAGQTRQVEIDVDWEVGLQEKVTVTAGAARAAKIVDAPAAVTSIPVEQIEREASTGQVPKILEFTPGAEVTQSGLYDFNFNTRGFNSSLNRRVSTYIDGRDVGVVLLGAQEWSALSGGLDDLQSLEFIRGPSAALYGANASSGVINITTKAPRDSPGTMVRVTGGELETFTVDFRHAGELGKGWFWKVLGGGKASGDFAVSRNPDVDPNAPEYSEFCMDIGQSDCLPEERTLFREQDNNIYFGSVRLDKYIGAGDALLTFEVGGSDIRGPVFQTGIGRVQNRESQRPFARVNWSKGHWNALAHWSRRKGNQANLNKALFANYGLFSDTKRYGAEGQGNWKFLGDRIRFVIGAAMTEERVDTSCDESAPPPGSLEPLACTEGRQTVVWQPISNGRQAVFSQFDFKASEHLKLVFAGRLDWNDLHDTQFSPKAALVYSINPTHSLRATYNRAFQVANYSEFFLNTRISAFPMGGFLNGPCVQFWANQNPPQPPVDCGIPVTDQNGNFTFIPIVAVGNNDLDLEKTEQWELGYSGLIGRRAFITLDYYNSKNTDFITDLVPQVGTSLGKCLPGDPVQDPTLCPINNDFLPWVSTEQAETTFLIPPSQFFAGLTVAQSVRNAVQSSVGGSTLGFRLGQNLDGSPVVIARTYTNVGRVDTQGIDFGVQIFATNALSIQASYSWFDFNIAQDNLDVSDVLLPNSPENKASLSVGYRTGRWGASVSGRWVEGFRWSAGIFQGEVPTYATGDLSGSYRFNDLVSVGVNVANFTDNVHRQTFGGDLISRRGLAYMTFNWGPGPASR